MDQPESATGAAISVSPPNLDRARTVLRRVWQYRDFRYHQRRVVLAALRGRDCLAVLPTGGGKSLCYQVPALVLPGCTLVISPLISLMQDQVGALRARGVSAAYLASGQRGDLQKAVRCALRAGQLKLLYIAPERLKALVASGLATSISRVAVDEAHCISEWGHEFRPQYRALGRHMPAVNRPPIMALTATATPETRRDIAGVLDLRHPVTVCTSFDRPNLRFVVQKFRSQVDRLSALATALQASSGTAIVYLPTRNQTDALTQVLRCWGLPAAPYHAGLPSAARRALLRRFLDGRLPIMVATSAFGMGIDRADVRLVTHLGVPTRPEAYFQEAGRAGRDGLPARCLLLWLEADLALAARMMRGPRSRGGGPSAIPLVARRRGFAAMQRYLTTRTCRRRLLLQYLGEEIATCTGCDRCG